MSSITIAPQEIATTQRSKQSKKNQLTVAPSVSMPRKASKARSPQRQRECLSDWDHAS